MRISRNQVTSSYTNRVSSVVAVQSEEVCHFRVACLANRTPNTASYGTTRDQRTDASPASKPGPDRSSPRRSGRSRAANAKARMLQDHFRGVAQKIDAAEPVTLRDQLASIPIATLSRQLEISKGFRRRVDTPPQHVRSCVHDVPCQSGKNNDFSRQSFTSSSAQTRAHSLAPFRAPGRRCIGWPCSRGSWLGRSHRRESTDWPVPRRSRR